MEPKLKFAKYISLLLGSALCIIFWLLINIGGFANIANLSMTMSLTILIAFLISNVLINFIIIRRIERLKTGIKWFSGFFQWIIPVTYIVIYGVITIKNQNVGFMIVYIAIGLLLFAMGLALPKIPFNDYGIGIKFPWILHNKKAWEITHRLSSIFVILGGIISMIFAFSPFTPQLLIIYVVLIIVVVSICPLIISIVAYNITKKKVI